MPSHAHLLLILPLLIATACAPNRQGDDDSQDDDDATGSDPETCMGVGSSTLAGACIWFPESGATWSIAEAAAGVTIPYVVLVEADISGVIPRPQDGGGCGQPGASGLILFEDLSGAGQRYCICDEGLCAAPPPTPVTIPAGQTSSEFTWTGRSWWGPSDTGNPMGAPFPPGSYTLEVSAVGTVSGEDFRVAGSFAVTLQE